jgi:3-oxoacyl-[acyl-carrier-protein] synthase-3
VPELLAPAASPHTATPERRAPVVARLASVALAVPETVVTNEDLAPRLGVDPGWITKRTGIEERHVAQPDERLSDMAARAGREALDRAGVAPEELDLVLVGTTTADELTPSAAPIVAHELGAPRAAAIDVGAACTGFISGLSLAAGQIEAGRARTALVIGADVLHRFLDLDDKRTAGIFGDGSGAVVLAAGEGPGGVGAFALHSDGSLAHAIHATRADAKIRMEGIDTFRNAVRRLSEATLEALDLAGAVVEDIDLFVYHQANSRILQAVGQELGLPSERVIDVISHYGNTSAASIPIALAEAHAAGRVEDGSLLLMGAFGAGFVWGAGVVEWGAGDGGR